MSEKERWYEKKIKLKDLRCAVTHKIHDPCFHKKYMETWVMTFMVHCPWAKVSNIIDLFDSCMNGKVYEPFSGGERLHLHRLGTLPCKYFGSSSKSQLTSNSSSGLQPTTELGPLTKVISSRPRLQLIIPHVTVLRHSVVRFPDFVK